jgi:CO/xanthine dehydrogenase Mo-binding subunit
MWCSTRASRSSIVNPLSMKKQIEGQIAWDLGDAMWKEITVKDGRVVEGNFGAFQIACMAGYPVQVDIVFLKSNNK